MQIIIGYLVADILTGAMHWFEDTYLDYCLELPIVGEISKDNELHHYFPRSMLAYSYMEHMTITLPLTLLLLVILYILYKPILNYPYFIASFAFFSITSNIIHRFSHMRDCENSPVILFLQKIGILSSHTHHSVHHNTPNRRYCVISTYNNYVLDSVNFWRIIENIIYMITGVAPHRKQTYDSYYKIHNHMHMQAKVTCPDTPTKQDVEELIQKLKVYKDCPVSK